MQFLSLHHQWHLRTPSNTALWLLGVCTVVKLLHLTPVPLFLCPETLKPTSAFPLPSPEFWALGIAGTDQNWRLLSNAVCHDWVLVENSAGFSEVAFCMQWRHSIHRHPSIRALLFPDKDGALSAILINPCQLCTDQARPASAKSPRRVFHSMLPASVQRDSCWWGRLWRWLSVPPRHSCWPSGDMGRGETPLRTTQITALVPQTCTSAQRHELCHLAAGWPPTTSAF